MTFLPLLFSVAGVCLIAGPFGALRGRGTFTALLVEMGLGYQRIFTVGAPTFGLMLIVAGMVTLPEMSRELRMVLGYGFLGCLAVFLLGLVWMCVPVLPLPTWLRVTREDLDARSRIERAGGRLVVHGTRPWGVFLMGCIATGIALVIHVGPNPELAVLVWPFAAGGFLTSVRGMLRGSRAELTAEGLAIDDGLRHARFAWGQVTNIRPGPLYLQVTAGRRRGRFNTGALGITSSQLAQLINDFHATIRYERRQKQ